MTDRYYALTVALERDTRDDDAASLIAAIKQMRGVLDVTGVVGASDVWVAEQRARAELRQKLMEVLYPKESTHER